MNIIKTKSFELAVNIKGDPSSTKLAILIPGRLDTKDYCNFVSHANYLVSKSFFVVAFDPPGTWDSPGGIDIYSTTNYIIAVNELIEYFGNKSTLLLGHSRGAATAILAGAPNPNVIGIVSIIANYGKPTPLDQESLQKGFKISYRDLPPGNSPTKKQKEFLLPISYWEDGKNYDAGDSLKKCSKPKLLVYGSKDEFTTVEEVEKLYTLIPEPKMLKLVDSTHDYRYFPEAIEEINLVIGKFLDSAI
ncbi:MAG: Alpha/beta hydrolase fold protein [Candidatus Magasanikbacteria bacterium GW2011_GWC2_37_14]|uniref:Alpha/beta hydrolase fold protein n=1 Tax=Candidatus Magasanikbacteria bacterium GW2011_GWC2_37_14 TaxID=1619046 RepID=A0A0G0GCU2_9BACT|nr:MAG: Alpha/beta hydrolase fold protein [Candidatus Magasanikbacteria bacterium GW2011_GWC2_37_14]